MESSSRKKQNTRGSSTEPQQVRKRHRVAIVCINCRRKKIKCDKKKPECDNCIKSNIKCQYQDLVWASSTMVDDDGRVSSYNDYSGQKIFMISDNGLVPFTGKDPAGFEDNNNNNNNNGNKNINNNNNNQGKQVMTNVLPLNHPPMDVNEKMDFFEGTMSTDEIVRSGPFSWLIFASKDRFIKFLWLKASQTKQRQLLYLDTSIKENLSSTDDDKNEQKPNLKNLKQKIMVPSYQPLPANQIRSIILKSLPTKKSLWILVPRFYQYIYPYLSYLNWDEFINTLKTTLNTHENDFADERFTTINITQKSSLCHFAMLFVVLRLGFLSLGEEVTDESENRKYILEHPISVESVSASQILLNQFNYFDKPPLELLEGFIYLRSYHHYSPEQGDNTGVVDSTVFNGIIVALAVTLGLNRDPSSIEQYKNDLELCNLRRRLWYFVAMFDLYQTVSLGRPVAYNVGQHDVKFPELQGDDDLDSKENRLTIGFKEYCTGCEMITKVASILSNANSTSIYELAKGVKRLDELKNKKFKSVTEILNQKTDLQEKPHVRLRRVVQFIRYVFLNTFCFTTEYNIFLHFENSSNPRGELARYYFSRIVRRSNETMESLPPLMTRASTYFGYGLDIIQFPATLLSLHKALQVQTSLSLRCQHLIKLMKLHQELGIQQVSVEENRKVYNYLKLIIKSISLKLEDYLKNLDNACKTYQYAWRLKRPHTLFWLITNQECFEIKNGKIVALGDEMSNDGADIPQTNILEGMSLKELMDLYPIPAEELRFLKTKKKAKNTSTTAEHQPLDTQAEEHDLVSPSVKDERSPTISNLLNHEDHENSSTSSYSFMKSPTLTSMKAIVDPTVDKNWIKLLYTNDINENLQYLNHLQEYQNNAMMQPNFAPINYHPSQVPVPQQQQQYPAVYHHVQAPLQVYYAPVPPQAHIQQPLIPAQQLPLEQHQPSFPHLTLQSNNNNNNYDTRMIPHSAPIVDMQNNNTVNNMHNSISNHIQPSNSANGLNEFFSLIGAGGFSTIDEMFGSVEFYDNSL